MSLLWDDEGDRCFLVTTSRSQTTLRMPLLTGRISRCYAMLSCKSHRTYRSHELGVSLTCSRACTHGIVVTQLTPGDHTHNLDVDPRTRSYLVHIPPAYNGSKAFPVVLAYHGGGSNADVTVPFTGLSDKADRSGFIVVYPSGTGRLPKALTWNAGNCSPVCHVEQGR